MGIYAGYIGAQVNGYGYAIGVQVQQAVPNWPLISWPFSATDPVQQFIWGAAFVDADPGNQLHLPHHRRLTTRGAGSPGRGVPGTVVSREAAGPAGPGGRARRGGRT